MSAFKGARRSFNKWKAGARRPAGEPIGAPTNLRTIRVMTWRECCAWLGSVGIPVSRSPPTLLRTLRAGVPYLELVRRISLTFWVRHKMAMIAEPLHLFNTLQAFYETAFVTRVLGCQRLDVAALVEGKAIEHLELLAMMRSVLEAARELEVAREGVMYSGSGPAPPPPRLA